MDKVLITTSSFNLDHPEIKEIEQAGYEVVLNPHGRRLNETEIKELLTPDIVGLIAGLEPLNRAVIQEAKGLRVISRCGIGMDNVDQDAAREHNIQLFNTPDAPTKAVAELALGLILSALRQIPFQDHGIKAGKWERPMGNLLSAKTVGIVGFGRIGKKLANFLQPFGTTVLAYDPYAGKEDLSATPHVSLVSLDELLSNSDIISLHTPHNEETHHLIDGPSIKKMKQGTILVNTSRGGLIDEDALADNLQKGHLAAAALDVFENEPYTGRLANIENVILTAHTGSYAKEARMEQEILAARNLLLGLKDQSGKKTYG